MNELLSAFNYFAAGALLGLTAGLSPGPLLTLVISETIKHSRKEGIKIAVSPLITDIPIVLVSIFVFSGLSHFNSVLGFISLLGAIFIAYLGVETLTVRELSVGDYSGPDNSIKKGVFANLLSPHPYLFWVTVGAPLAFKAHQVNIFALILYFMGFYLCLVGSKIGIAHIVAKSKTIFSKRLYVWTMRILAFSMFVFSAFFLFEGLKYFGFIGV